MAENVNKKGHFNIDVNWPAVNLCISIIYIIVFCNAHNDRNNVIANKIIRLV